MTHLSQQAQEARERQKAMSLDEKKRTDPEFRARWDALLGRAARKTRDTR